MPGTDTDGEPRRKLNMKKNLTFVSVAFKNKIRLLIILVCWFFYFFFIMDFSFASDPKMLKDKCSYYPNKLSVKLIARCFK